MESFNPLEMWHHMGLLDKGVVSLLVLMSIYSLWVMIDRAVVFAKAKRYSLSFVLALRDRMACAHSRSASAHAQLQKNWNSAKAAWASGRSASRSSAARMLCRAVGQASSGDSNPSIAAAAYVAARAA